jgi:hypothetical protein
MNSMDEGYSSDGEASIRRATVRIGRGHRYCIYTNYVMRGRQLMCTVCYLGNIGGHEAAELQHYTIHTTITENGAVVEESVCDLCKKRLFTITLQRVCSVCNSP